MAAASESLESLLLLLLLFEFEFELLFEFESLFELLFELELPPPTKFWMKSCNLPHSTGLAGSRMAIRQSEQQIKEIIFMLLSLPRASFLLLTFLLVDPLINLSCWLALLVRANVDEEVVLGIVCD